MKRRLDFHEEEEEEEEEPKGHLLEKPRVLDEDTQFSSPPPPVPEEPKTPKLIKKKKKRVVVSDVVSSDHGESIAAVGGRTAVSRGDGSVVGPKGTSHDELGKVTGVQPVVSSAVPLPPMDTLESFL